MCSAEIEASREERQSSSQGNSEKNVRVGPVSGIRLLLLTCRGQPEEEVRSVRRQKHYFQVIFDTIH